MKETLGILLKVSFLCTFLKIRGVNSHKIVYNFLGEKGIFYVS